MTVSAASGQRAHGRVLKSPLAVPGSSAAASDLSSGHRDLLLADARELRGRMPADLPGLMTLEEWHQPWPLVGKFLTDAVDDFREHEAYRMLAEVLASGDTGLYQPTLEPNTHWSNWLDAGAR